MTAMFPFAEWLAGTNQNSIPANDNALRNEVLARSAEGVADSEPVSPAEREVWIVGTTWGGFATDSVVIYLEGTWYEFLPFEGWAKTVDGILHIYSGAWVPALGSVDRASVTAVSSVSGVVTLDYSQGDYFTLALTENVTSWVIANPPGSGLGFTLMVQINQDSTPRTVAKPGTTSGGADLDVSTGSGDVDVLAITSFDNAATLRSSIAKAFS